MNYSISLPAVALALTSAVSFASDFTCKTVSGTIQQLTPDSQCNIITLQQQQHQFPDLTFLGALGAPGTCFSTQLQGTLDSIPFSGTVYSGLTVNGLNQMTAASAIRLNSGNIELGRIFSTDLIFNPEGGTMELLTMVNGTRMFRDGHGNLTVTGNALLGTVNFAGKLCILNY